MITKKVMAFTVAFLMLAVGVVVSISDSQSDATDTDPNTTVKVFFDGSGDWESASYYKFNVFQAIQAACGPEELCLYVVSNESDWTETTLANGTYPNPDYGTIYGVGTYQQDETVVMADSFEIYGCNDDGDWVEITPYALGWIRPFTDYANYAKLVYNNLVVPDASAFANIAITVGNQDIYDIDESELKVLTNPVGRNDCTYTFVLKDPNGLVDFGSSTYYARTTSASAAANQITMAQLQAGITAYGYGSDAFLALVYATNGATFGQQQTYELHGTSPNTYYTNYSWMDYLFGVGTQTTDLGDGHYQYEYWASYKGTGSTAEYTSFNLGYHTQIPDAYSHEFNWGGVPYNYVCNGNVFTMEYSVS